MVAGIPGTYPKLKSEVVMLGGHLDSWTAATGATDNGAGAIVALEAVRILKTLGTRPRRTVMDDLRQAATIEAAFVYFAAMRPEMMPRKPLGPPEKFIFDDLIP